MKFTFKGEDNFPGQEWNRGFNDCIYYHKFWYPGRRHFLKGEGEYTNGWAEGNITSHSNWTDYWQQSIKNRDN